VRTLAESLLCALAGTICGLTVAGCATPLPTHAQEEEAVREVWLQNHGPRLARFPDSYSIVWETDCVWGWVDVRPGHREWKCRDGFIKVAHERLGDTWDCEMHVTWRGRISLTELCHEAEHCLQDVAGQRDHFHEDLDDQEAVLRAERALETKGL